MRIESDEELKKGVGVAGRAMEQEVVACWSTKADKIG